MSWDTAHSPRFSHDDLFQPVDDTYLDEEWKSARDFVHRVVQSSLSRIVLEGENNNLAPELAAVLEHRYWMTIIIRLTPGPLRGIMMDLLLDISKTAYSEPEKFAKFHLNVSMVLSVWKGLASNDPKFYKSLGLDDFKKHLQSFAWEGNAEYAFRPLKEGEMKGINTRGFESLAEMEEQRKVYATTIFENYRQLQKIVMAYGEKLKHRWNNSWYAMPSQIILIPRCLSVPILTNPDF